ncbi:MAG: PmoA family protein, partial [Pirellulales bacterium]|nr:PmoA family protein [Pirellulales bacterium]
QTPPPRATAVKSADGSKIVVELDGKPFAEYLTRSGTKPIVWPIIGPSGVPMTRQWPMADKRPGEPTDHLWHRSLWFTHGMVNGHDFWSEPRRRTGKAGRKGCVIAHREFVKIESGPAATLTTRNDWLDPKGKKILEDQRTLRFGGDASGRWIDFDVTLKATEGPVTFGDTKEGSMGIRMAAPLAPDAKQGGRLVNDKGQENAEAWGKRASWVDYSGPLEGQTVGICMMNHPSSFRYPTHWHARTYGLCSANPFGWRDFEGGESVDGSCTIAQGESITLRYRILFHQGDAKSANLAAAFERYAGENHKNQ